MSRRLIVTADDVGLDPGMTEGAIVAHREGIVTACSVVANGGAFEDALMRLRDVPTLEVGVHLTLVEEQPLTDIALPKSYTSFVPRFLAGALPLSGIERELRAQIERVLGSGLRVTHLNSHQHLHALPAIFELTVRLAVQYNVPYVRVPRDVRVRGGLWRVASVAALGMLAARGRARVGSRVVTNDVTIGITEAGRLTEAELHDLVTLIPDGVTELVTHPGVGVRRYAHWRYSWDAETRVLCDPAIREAFVARGIDLVAPSMVK